MRREDRGGARVRVGGSGRRRALARAGLIALAGVLCVSSGCGQAERENSVSGTVSLRGERRFFGVVNLTDAQGMVRGGGIDPDGGYRVLQIAPGRYKVHLASPATGPTPDDLKAAQEKIRGVPKQYLSADTTPLSVEIGPGQNRFDIAIE